MKIPQIIGLLSMFVVGVASAQSLIGIPLKPDPPIAIDGDLGDWSGVPNAMTINQKAQAVFGEGNWTSPTDMSGVIRLAWREEHLFIAAEVQDDVLAQSQRSTGIWQGDHIELYLDVLPTQDTDRRHFGLGQFHISLSPGNFKNTGDTLIDTPPESYCYVPEGKDINDILVASKQVDGGWVLEAAIPWMELGVKPRQSMPIHIEVGLSDTDSTEPRQETLLTIQTKEWEHSRDRLVPMVLSASDGVAIKQADTFSFLDDLAIEQGKTKTLGFTVPALPEGEQAVLRIMGRLHTNKVAGFTQSLRILLNGQGLNGKRLLNKSLRETSRSGQSYTMYADERMATYYSPSFEAPNDHAHYGLQNGVIPCLFELDISDIVKEGHNEITIEHSSDTRIKNVLHVGQGEILFRLPPPPEAVKAGPPTGVLAEIMPRAKTETEYNVKTLPGSKLAVSFSDHQVILESRFSTPKPGWVHGSNPYFKHQRRLENTPEGIIVYDTFTNLTDENLGIMHRHEAKMAEALNTLWIAGLKQPGKSGRTNTPANCTSLGLAETFGIGLIARDDVFRVHSTNYGLDGMIGVADNNLVLPPNTTYTAEWIIVPVENPDYFHFINIARRFMGANFEIDGGFAFLRQGPLTDKWSDDQLSAFLINKDAKYVCSGITYPRYISGRYNHGTAFQKVSHDAYRESFKRWRGLYPIGNYQIYFHCFLDVTEEGVNDFSDSRTLRPDGTQATYGKDHQRIYFPTENNSFGPAIAKSIDMILDDIGADGVYWDEHQYSRYTYHYGEPWDNITGDIHPTTMKVNGLKSSITLLTEDWRVKIAKNIQARGSLIGNGAPYTQAMVELKFPCFVETGSISHCRKSHLYSPIALGDHLTERSEEDAYQTMLDALDFGCVYHWYNDMLVQPTHKTITSYMFPITPIEIHQGYIIGEERIITKKSGLYGWGDDSTHEVHVYNDRGVKVENFNSPQIQRAGKTFTELRIAEDWSAAIIRK